MKKLRYLLCVCVMIASMSVWSHDFEIDGIYYNKIDSVSVCVTNNNGSYHSYYDDVVIPRTVTYNGTEYSVTSIEERAFALSDITSVTVPNSVSNIGMEAFSSCSRLASVIVENGNTHYDSREDCNAIIETATNTLIFGCENTVIPHGVTSIGKSAFFGCCYLDSVTIPNSVTSIGENAFRGCSCLTSVTIPDSVTSIGDSAFYYCNNLESVTIPNSVTSIGAGAFGFCISLTSMVVEDGNVHYDSRENCNAIIETATNTLIFGCKNTVIPNSVTSIGEGAFHVSIFLTSITIPNGVTSIGKEAFCGCSGLTSVTIPSSVTSIGGIAFANCDSLNTIICDIEVPLSIDSRVFRSVDKSKCVLFVPNGCVDAYKSAEVWKEFANIREIGDVTSITETSLEECTPGMIYNLRGQKVDNTYRGIVIKNGKKVVKG